MITAVGIALLALGMVMVYAGLTGQSVRDQFTKAIGK